MRPVRRLYGATPARSFGPLALRAVRDAMVKDGLARTTINGRVGRIRRAFKWAASVEMILASVAESLRTVDGLREGRTESREAPPVQSVPVERVEATLPLLPRPIAAMVRFQLLTGCRGGEVMAIRGCDLKTDDLVWEYRPGRHKSRWRGKARVIPLGPRAQEVVREFLKADPAAYLFSPSDTVAEVQGRRRASRKSRPTLSEKARRKDAPGAGHGRRYKKGSYLQAVMRACRRAGVPHWSPLQLRHTAATTIRARYGLETAQTVLGHSRADVTQIYAERDLEKARAAMAEIG